MKYPVFDLHCDTLSYLLGEDWLCEESLLTNAGHWDITRAGQMPAFAQCFGCFTTPLEKLPENRSAVQKFEQQIAVLQREVNAHSDKIAIAYTASDVEENAELGRISAILTIEGPAGFDCDPDLLQDLYLAGFRISNLCWNERNPLTGSIVIGGGLTDLGREYVKKAQKCGMLVDVSHISDEAFWDVIDVTSAPILATHSNSRQICPVPRNLTDDMFRAICATGGLTGLNLYAAFIGGDTSVDAACDHIMHYLELDPEGTHIALGGDLDGCDRLLRGFAGVQDYPALAECLSRRGISDKQIKNIFWNNALEVFRKCCI